MRIGIAQIAADTIDPFETSHYERFVARACAAGCAWVLFPELSDSGYDLETRAAMTSSHQAALADMARDARLWIFAGLRKKEETGEQNTLMVFSPDGRSLPYYSKMHLFSHETLCEDAIFVAGSSPVVVKLDAFCVGLSICFDLRFAALYRAYAHAGADIFVVAAAWPEARIADWQLLLQARALESQAFAIGVNYSGKRGAVTFGGRSMVCGPDGKVLATASADASALLVCDLDLEEVGQIRQDFPVLRHDREIGMIVKG